jgi:hypothetical protein
MTKLHHKIKTRLESFPKKSQWEELFTAIVEDADVLRESWFGIDFVVRSDDTWQKVRDHWMAWRKQQGKQKPPTWVYNKGQLSVAKGKAVVVKVQKGDK